GSRDDLLHRAALGEVLDRRHAQLRRGGTLDLRFLSLLGVLRALALDLLLRLDLRVGACRNQYARDLDLMPDMWLQLDLLLRDQGVGRRDFSRPGRALRLNRGADRHDVIEHVSFGLSAAL